LNNRCPSSVVAFREPSFAIASATAAIETLNAAAVSVRSGAPVSAPSASS
jgi:uncharacterized protein YraI